MALAIVSLRPVAFAASPDQASQTAAAPAYVLTVAADHADALYQPGEPVTFVVNVADAQGKPANGTELTWSLIKDGVTKVKSGTVAAQDGVARITGSLAGPGFLKCDVTVVGTGKPAVQASAGAGFAPTQIKPSMPVPDDFDAFWAAKKAELAQVPANARLTPVTAPKPGVEVFDLQADCIGAPVSGYLARPVNAKPHSLPAILCVQYAGVRDSRMGLVVNYAADQHVLALDINVHGLPNGRPDAYYADLAKGELADYRKRGRESRDTIYFLGMFLRVVRAIDVLTAQPEWDGRTLVVVGDSQGGAQSIAAAGLDSRVTFFAAGFPAMCDHTGMMADRIAGWPRMVPMDKAGKPDPVVLNVSRYFDMVNFATRAKAPGVFAAGFVDVTCPPCTVYAAYNALPSPAKAIYNDIQAGHGNMSKPVRDQLREAVIRYLATQSRK
jgi:cephalosporin-C deacetylase